MKTRWVEGVTQDEVDAVPERVREAIEFEQRRVFSARLRVWCEWRIQQLAAQHGVTKLDALLRAFGAVLLREVKKTADEFMVENSKDRTARRKRRTYELQKQQRAEARRSRREDV